MADASVPGRRPRAYVLTAGFDPRRDKGRTHADALEAAGVAVVRAEHAGQIHVACG